MEGKGRDFICLNCGSRDFGKYCSNCRAPLSIGAAEFPAILSRWLINSGYQDVRELGRTDLVTRAKAHVPQGSMIPALAHILLSQTPSSYGRYLVLDRSNIGEIEVLFIVHGGAPVHKQLSACLASAAAALNKARAGLQDHRRFEIKRIKLVTWLIYSSEGSFIESDLGWLKARFPKKRKSKPALHFDFSAINLVSGKIYPKSLAFLDPEKRRILRCAFRQLHLEKTLKQEHGQGFWDSLVQELFHKPTAVFQDLAWLFLSVLSKPMHYADQIQEGRITLAHAVSYLGLLAVFLDLVERTVGMNEFTAIKVAPVVDEILNFAVMFALQAALAGVMFLAFRAVGGKGTYSKTLIAQIVLAIVFIPIAHVIDAAVFFADPQTYASSSISPGTRSQNGLNAGYAIPMYCIVHGISRAKVVLGEFLISAVVAILAIPIISLLN